MCDNYNEDKIDELYEDYTRWDDLDDYIFSPFENGCSGENPISRR